MTEAQEAPHRYDPLWDDGPRRKGLKTEHIVAGVVVLALHAGLIYYLYKTKIEPKYVTYEDVATKVDLVKPAPPPPPPPPLRRRRPRRPDAAADRAAPHAAAADVAPLAGAASAAAGARAAPGKRSAASACAAVAPAPPAAPAVITSPDWIRKPDGNDLADLFPDRAQRLEKSGSTTMTCTVRANGMLTACAIVNEDPSGYGFGEAALKAASRFKMRPATADGRPVEGAKVTIPIRWTLPAS